jgi:hypothetical protein
MRRPLRPGLDVLRHGHPLTRTRAPCGAAGGTNGDHPHPGCETVPIHISQWKFTVVNGFKFDYLDVTGTFSGPVEPD